MRKTSRHSFSRTFAASLALSVPATALPAAATPADGMFVMAQAAQPAPQTPEEAEQQRRRGGGQGRAEGAGRRGGGGDGQPRGEGQRGGAPAQAPPRVQPPVAPRVTTPPPVAPRTAPTPPPVAPRAAQPPAPPAGPQPGQRGFFGKPVQKPVQQQATPPAAQQPRVEQPPAVQPQEQQRGRGFFRNREREREFQRQRPPQPSAQPSPVAPRAQPQTEPAPNVFRPQPDRDTRGGRDSGDDRRGRFERDGRGDRDSRDARGDRGSRPARDIFGRDGNPPPQAERRRWREERRATERNQGFGNIEALRQRREEQRGERGRSILVEPDNRRIIRGRDRNFIVRDETQRIRRFGSDASTRRRPGGGNITTIVRPGGVSIISETSPDGRLIRRYRRGPGGRETVLIDNRRTWRKWGAIAAGAAVAGLLVSIAPPRYRGPRDSYIIDYERASYDDVYDALIAPPIDDLDRSYTLDEVLGTYNLRERMRRIDLDSINFESGSWAVDESQYDKLERVARAIGRIIDRNPDEVILIEGYTDAVGDDIDNLSLSDRRAEEVANILTEEFQIPPENLVTQGYGEQHLKIETESAERANRRVTVRRITPLLERRVSGYRD